VHSLEMQIGAIAIYVVDVDKINIGNGNGCSSLVQQHYVPRSCADNKTRMTKSLQNDTVSLRGHYTSTVCQRNSAWRDETSGQFHLELCNGPWVQIL